MKMHNLTVAAALVLGATSMLASATGCELLASVDRSLITGGTGGTGTTTTATTGGGGTGGMTTSTTGGGGTGGTTPMCTDAAKDCPKPASECVMAICTADKVCGTSNVAKDTPLATQTPTDCKMAVCDGNGGVGSKDDNADVKDDGNPCTKDSCNGGAEVHAPEDAGTACTDAGNAKAKLCDGASKCVECNVATQVANCDSDVCQDNACVSAQCNDGVKNGNETDKDCGGADCGKCDDLKVCGGNGDCKSGVCTGGTCAVPTCSDNVQNGAETDKDCGGGACAKCGPDKGCTANTDCVGGDCNGTTCNVTCTDLVLNNGESDADCGGANCPKCVDGKTCALGSDCTSLSCSGNPKVCQAPACNDLIKNGNESDQDCGGTCGATCATSKLCNGNGDCVSNHCVGGMCAAPSCNDGVKNQGESDTDCGGANCGPCGTGKTCSLATDCSSANCAGNPKVCVASGCSDNIKNQGESDTDCGGANCPKCGPNKTCTGNSDCLGNVCNGGGTCTPNCSDTVKDNVETDVDCGGGTCGTCALGKTCASGSDCASTICTSLVCSQINACDPTTALDLTGMANVAVNFGGAAGNMYAPPCIKVSAGTIVTFNGDFTFHPLQGGTVTGSGASIMATPSAVGPFGTVTNTGVSKPFTMMSAGTFPYYCENHYPSGMFGAVFVQ